LERELLSVTTNESLKWFGIYLDKVRGTDFTPGDAIFFMRFNPDPYGKVLTEWREYLDNAIVDNQVAYFCDNLTVGGFY